MATITLVSDQGSRFKRSSGNIRNRMGMRFSSATDKNSSVWESMKSKFYTFFIASNQGGKVHRVRLPFYLLHLLTILAIVGGITVVAAVGSYSRMLWKVTNYNALRRDQANLKQQYRQLQTEVKDTNQRLNSLQSLASEVAVSYGVTRFGSSPFARPSSSVNGPESAYQQSMAQFNFLEQNAMALTSPVEGLRLMPGPRLGDEGFIPSLWPVLGKLTGAFGQRLDPFSGEGAFHSGVDIGSRYGDRVYATADGVVTEVRDRGGYGRTVIIDHGFGLSTWYAHLSAYATHAGMHVKGGEVIGFVGQSGRATAPHVHYEVRLHDTPVNPWRYLRSGSRIGD
jgi:murein DD-endopeptidase MepM/ murein hydrolase activator NlpD